jgi:hypothetical protein
MNEMTTAKSQKTQERIDVISVSLKFHYENVELLNKSFEEREKIKKGSSILRKIKYSSIPRSEKIYIFTLTNIKSQISLLERELAVLVEYGA